MACVLRLCRPKHLEDRYYDPDDEPDFGVGGGGGGGGGLEGDHEGGLDPRAPRVQRASTVSLVPPWTTGRLVVEVLGARGLAAVDDNGLSDPFVTVRLATPGSGASLPKPHDKLHRTATVKECLSPRYKQERFVYDDIRAPLPDVRFEVYDWSPGLFGEKSEPLGTCHLCLGNHWRQTGGDVTDGQAQAEWLPLEPLVVGKARPGRDVRSDCGELEVRVTLRRGTGDMQEDAVAEADAARWFVDEDAMPTGELKHAEHAANTLRVAVVRAINLIAADSALFGGKSDPFVTLTVGSAKFKTRVVRKNLNPVWMQTFDVPFQWDHGVPPALNVKVEDWDFGSSPDFLGQCQIQPISLPKCTSDGAAPATWYALEGDDEDDDHHEDGGGVDRGQVQLAIKMVYDPANDPSEDRPFFDEPIEEKHAKMAPNELRIAVCRAKGVKAMDIPMPFSSKAATSDPYVVIKVAGRPEKKTRTRLATLSPVWNEVFAFDLHHEDLAAHKAKSDAKGRRLTCLSDATVDLVMWDWDRLDKDDFMGKVTLPLLPYASNGQKAKRGWYKLADVKAQADGDHLVVGDGSLGQVLVVAQWRYNPALDFAPLEEGDDADPAGTSANELRLALHRGRDLAIKDKNMFSEGGTSDPRMVFRVMDGSVELARWMSTTRNKTLDPVWRETYAKELRETKVAVTPNLVLRCMCEDVDIGSTDYMGQFDIRLNELVEERPSVKSGWYALRPGETTISTNQRPDDITGDIRLSIQWRHNPALDFNPWIADECDVITRPPNELRVALIRCADLEAHNTSLLGPGSANPFVRFSVTGLKNVKPWRSTTKKRTLEPSWCETWCFPLDDAPAGDEVLEVCVEDEALTSNRETDMGQASVPIGHLAAAHGRERKWHSLVKKGQAAGCCELVVTFVYSRAHDFDPWEHGHGANSTTTLPNELHLGLIAGRDVGVSDPKVVFHIDGAANGPLDFASSVGKGSHPIWCEAFALPMTMGEDAPTLTATLDDGGAAPRRLAVPLDALGDGVKRKRAWHKLQVDAAKDGSETQHLATKEIGALQLMMHWIYNPALAFAPFPPEDAASAARAPNTIRVALCQGKGIAARPEDTYTRGKALRLRVRFTVTGTDLVATSSTRESPGFSPNWTETFSLNYAAPTKAANGLNNGASPKKDLPPLVQLEAYVEGLRGDAADGAPPEAVGYVKVPLDDLGAKDKRGKPPLRKWFPVADAAGDLELILQWRYAPHHDPWHEPLDPAKGGKGVAAQIATALLPKKDHVVAFELHTDEVEMSLVDDVPNGADAPLAF